MTHFKDHADIYLTRRVTEWRSTVDMYLNVAKTTSLNLADKLHNGGNLTWVAQQSEVIQKKLDKAAGLYAALLEAQRELTSRGISYKVDRNLDNRSYRLLEQRDVYRQREREYQAARSEAA